MNLADIVRASMSMLLEKVSFAKGIFIRPI